VCVQLVIARLFGFKYVRLAVLSFVFGWFCWGALFLECVLVGRFMCPTVNVYYGGKSGGRSGSN